MSDTINSIADTERSTERLAAWAALAASAEDPAVAAEAKVNEIMDARHLGLQQHAVVAGTELLSLLPACETMPDRAPWGLKCAIGAALDIPEIPLQTVDQLVDVLGQVLDAQKKKPFAAWQLRARRAFVAGDDVTDWVEKLVPAVSRTNHIQHDLDCPGCTLAQFAQYLGPDAAPEVLAEVLEPILSGRLTYKTEDPAFVPILKLFYGERESCENGLQASHAWYARALLRAGRTAEAQQHVRKALSHRSASEVGMWALVAWLEAAEARGDTGEQRKALDEILSHLPKHEDAGEALEMAAVSARVLAVLGDPRAAEIRAMAVALAERLDARLERPRHVAGL